MSGFEKVLLKVEAQIAAIEVWEYHGKNPTDLSCGAYVAPICIVSEHLVRI